MFSGKKKADQDQEKLFFTRGGFGVKRISKERIKRNLSVLRELAKEGYNKNNGSGNKKG